MGTERTRRSKPSSTKSYYTFPDEVLQKWSRDGDARAEGALRARQAVHRLATTPDTGTFRDYSCFLSNGLRVDFHKDINGWVSMAVRVEEDTTRDGLVMAWKELNTWRTFLAEWQGPWCVGGHGQLLTQLHYRQHDGAPWPTLAQELNDAAADYLKRYTRKEDPYGLDRAQTLFRIMGLKTDEIEGWCAIITDRLSGGKNPFISKKDQPISKQHLMTALRTWRLQNKPWTDANPPQDQRVTRRLNQTAPRHVSRA